jgi:uncharacterized membrane protein (DUF106 family)
MATFNAAIGGAFGLAVLPFRAMNPWLAMIVVSVLTGLLMLAVFRWTSNQEGIRRTKEAIKAHLLELRLYQDSMAQQMRSQGRILRANGRYILLALRPMLVMIVPVLLLLIQLNLWFGSRPLAAGETAILKVKLAAGRSPLATDISLEAPPGVTVETPPLRIEEEREIDWRLRAAVPAPATYDLVLKLGPDSFTKSLRVGGSRLDPISNVRPGASLLDQIFNPGEKPLPRTLPIESVEVDHPERRLPFLCLRLHWLVAYFALSIVFGFALKGVFKVEI